MQCGVIECVPNSKSRDQIGRQTDITLFEYFLATFGDEQSPQFQEVRRETLVVDLVGRQMDLS